MSQPDLTLLWLRASLRYSVHLDTRSFSNKNESKYVVPTWASPFLTSPWSFLTLKCLPQIQIRILRLIIKEDICDAHPSWSGRRPYPRRLKRKLALTNLTSLYLGVNKRSHFLVLTSIHVLILKIRKKVGLSHAPPLVVSPSFLTSFYLAILGFKLTFECLHWVCAPIIKYDCCNCSHPYQLPWPEADWSQTTINACGNGTHLKMAYRLASHWPLRVQSVLTVQLVLTLAYEAKQGKCNGSAYKGRYNWYLPYAYKEWWSVLA